MLWPEDMSKMSKAPPVRSRGQTERSNMDINELRLMAGVLRDTHYSPTSVRCYNLALERHGWDDAKVDSLVASLRDEYMLISGERVSRGGIDMLAAGAMMPDAMDKARRELSSPDRAKLKANPGIGCPGEAESCGADSDVLAALDGMDAPEEDPQEREKRVKAAFSRFETSVQKMDARIRKLATIAEYQNPDSPAMRYHSSKIKLFDGASNGRGDQKTGAGTGVRVVKWTAGKPKLMFAWRWGHCSDTEVQDALKRFEDRAARHVADLARSMGIGAK